MDQEIIDLNNLFCTWYGLTKYMDISKKSLPQGQPINFTEPKLLELWQDIWFAKNQQMVIMDKFLKKYENLINDQEQLLIKKNFDFSEYNLFQKMSLIILFDQIPRNIYRGTAEAYKFDYIVQKISLCLIKQYKLCDELPFHFICTIVVSLCHSENPEDQEANKQIVESLYEKYKNEFTTIKIMLKQLFMNHYERIKMFGRIPERNVYLGRKSTESEIAFIKTTDITKLV